MSNWRHPVANTATTFVQVFRANAAVVCYDITYLILVMIVKGTSINDVTQFRGKIDTPLPLCHTWSQISDPPTEITSQAYTPSPFKKAAIIACRN